MDFTALVAATYLRLGVPSGDALLTTAIVGQAVNEALHEIDSEQDWPWLEASETLSTVAGTATVTPGATWLRTRGLRIVDGYPMDRYTIDELNDMWPFSAQTNRPQIWAISDGVIHLRPVPDAVYSLKHTFIQTQADIAGATSPLMPVQFHPAIACLAAHIALGRARDDYRAGEMLQDYQRWEQKMLRHKRRFRGPGRIRSRWDA